MHQSAHQDSRASITPQFSRRVLTKAAAGYAAAASFATFAGAPRTAIAQEATTLAGEWGPPDGVGGENGTLAFSTEFPFYAIAPHWSGETDINAAVELSVSTDGNTFSEPVTIGPAADAGRPSPSGRVFGQLLMTDRSSVVRYRTLNANGDEVTVPGLRFTYIDATGGPALGGNVAPASLPETLTRPPVITRDQWGASLAYGGWDAGASQWPPEYRTVEHIIIHHSATPSFRDPLVEIRSIHYYHAVTRGWGDIGYNYLVDFLGNVYEGRKGGENAVGGHAFQYNYGSCGICSMGNFSLESSTPEAIGALIWISAWAGRNLDPLGYSDFHEQPNLPTICGHRDVLSTGCPGDALYADLPYIRTAVAEVLAGGGSTGTNAAYASGDVIATSVTNANLRSGPGTDTSVASRLPIGTVLTIIEGPTTTDGYDWYHVSGEQNDGWLASVTFAASTSAPPSRDYSPGTEIGIATNLLNLRDAPGLDGAIIATLANGDTATVVGGPETGGGFTWLQVESHPGTGWLAQQYVAPTGQDRTVSAFSIGDNVEVDTDALNLRTDPSLGASVITVLLTGAGGTVVDGPGQADGVSWMKIRTDAGTGWMAAQYLGEAEDASAPDARFAVGDDVVIDTDALNLRNGTGLDSTVITVLWTGTPGSVTDGPVARGSYTWYEIRTSQGTGWVAGDFLVAAESDATPASGFEPGTAITVTTNALNLRASASLSGAGVAVAKHGDTGSVTGATQQADGYTWVETTFGGSSGWVATAFVSRGSTGGSSGGRFAADDDATVTSNNLNVRALPSLSAEVLGQLDTGDVVGISGGPQDADGYTWYEIDAAQWSGWTVAVWLEPSTSGAFRIGANARVFDGELNLRSGPSTSNSVERILPDGAIVDVLAGPETSGDYDWYRVTSSRYGTGWAVGRWLEPA